MESMEGQRRILVALGILPFVDWQTLLQLRVASRIFDCFEAEQQLGFSLQERAERLAQLAEFFRRR